MLLRVSRVATTLAGLTALGLSSCLNLAPPPEFISSQVLDYGTWSASVCGDADADGRVDIAVWADSDDPKDEFHLELWLVSSADLRARFALVAEPCDGAPTFMIADRVLDRSAEGRGKLGVSTVHFRGDKKEFSVGNIAVLSRREGALLQTGEQAAREISGENGEGRLTPPRSCVWSTVIAPERDGWLPGMSSDFDSNGAQEPPIPGLGAREAACREKLTLAKLPVHDLHACGDLDDDGIMDWLGLADDPRRALVISGRDASVLREMRFGPDRYATVATGMQELGDVDGDGVTDFLVVGHVSRSTERLARRTCLLGLVSIVSGADGRVLRTIEREAFVHGPGATCKRVVIPD